MSKSLVMHKNIVSLCQVHTFTRNHKVLGKKKVNNENGKGNLDSHITFEPKLSLLAGRWGNCLSFLTPGFG